MSIVFAAGVSHAPGSTAWPELAPPAQKQAVYDGYARVRGDLAASGAETVLVFTSEHWTNFFFENMPSFCVGRADAYWGPVEPWLKVSETEVPGDSALARDVIAALFAAGVNPSYSDELKLDHGTMVPVHFLLAGAMKPVVPIVINTLAEPMPSSESCFRLGAAVGAALRASPRKVAVIATGGLSHAPGERAQGFIDAEFDATFLAGMANADLDALRGLSHERMAAAGGGAHEVRAWIALAGALGGWKGETIAYEAIVPWATGFGLMEFHPAA
jgi:aromatic ring-opening dioxygenase catalytic subunit (LigB family)